MMAGERIQAVFILQKFVRMSRFLLPAYLYLNQKSNLNKKELKKMSRIKSVYDSFNADSKTSIDLINSNIIDMIKSLYTLSKVNKDIENSDTYKQFINESDLLIQTWNKQILN